MLRVIISCKRQRRHKRHVYFLFYFQSRAGNAAPENGNIKGILATSNGHVKVKQKHKATAKEKVSFMCERRKDRDRQSD